MPYFQCLSNFLLPKSLYAFKNDWGPKRIWCGLCLWEITISEVKTNFYLFKVTTKPNPLHVKVLHVNINLKIYFPKQTPKWREERHSLTFLQCFLKSSLRDDSWIFIYASAVKSVEIKITSSILWKNSTCPQERRMWKREIMS
jgi:hypothetical protein